MEALFGNPGRKIKVVSFVWFILEVVVSVIGGFVMIAEEEAFAGLLIILLGVGASYLSTLVLYAFGELVEKMTKTEENTRKQNFYNSFNASYQGDLYAQTTQQYAPQYNQQYTQYNQQQYAPQYTQQQYTPQYNQEYAPQYNQAYTQTAYDVDQELTIEENRVERLAAYNSFVANSYAELQNKLLNGVISKNQYLAQLKEIQ